MKIKTITVHGPTEIVGDKAGQTATAYWVGKVTDSTRYAPNTWLSKDEVQFLCEAKNWKVTVLPLNK